MSLCDLFGETRLEGSWRQCMSRLRQGCCGRLAIREPSRPTHPRPLVLRIGFLSGDSEQQQAQLRSARDPRRLRRTDAGAGHRVQGSPSCGRSSIEAAQGRHTGCVVDEVEEDPRTPNGATNPTDARPGVSDTRLDTAFESLAAAGNAVLRYLSALGALIDPAAVYAHLERIGQIADAARPVIEAFLSGLVDLDLNRVSHLERWAPDNLHGLEIEHARGRFLAVP